MKVIDCFIFYNEIDLLRYRLHALNDVVDYFILVEATRTHVGKEKPLYFEEHKQEFSAFLPKIIHIIVDDFKYTYPTLDISKKEQWENEWHQRNTIAKGIQGLNLADDDIILICDVDEIPDPATLRSIKDSQLNNLVCLEMTMYCYDLTMQFVSKWYHAKMLTYAVYKTLNMTIDNIRLSHFYRHVPVLNKGGWHLSFFGGTHTIKNKVESYTHQELNVPSLTVELIQEKINSVVYFGDAGRPLVKIPIEQNSYLPTKYYSYLTMFF